MNQTETTTKTVTIEYDEGGRVIREVTEVIAEIVNAISADVAGRCGHQAPQIVAGPPSLCALPAGHAGWHREDEGAEWGVAATSHVTRLLDDLIELHASTEVPQDPDARRVFDAVPDLCAAVRAVLELAVAYDRTPNISDDIAEDIRYAITSALAEETS